MLVILELLDEGGFLAFGQNNNPTGAEDPEFVEGLISAARMPEPDPPGPPQ